MHGTGLGEELYHPPGQSAAAGAPGGRRSPQGLSSCGRNPEVEASRSIPALTCLGTTTGSPGLLQEHWGYRRRGTQPLRHHCRYRDGGRGGGGGEVPSPLAQGQGERSRQQLGEQQQPAAHG